MAIASQLYTIVMAEEKLIFGGWSETKPADEQIQSVADKVHITQIYYIYVHIYIYIYIYIQQL